MNLAPHGWPFALLRRYARLAPTERGGFRLARLARGLVPRQKWRGVFATGSGVRLDLDLATYPDVAMAAGVYELDTQRLLRHLLRPGMHFVDGGANIGFFTCRAAQLVGPTGRVDAFEPDPQNNARLEANLARNGLADRVKVHPLALAERSARLTFHRPAAGSRRNHGESGRFPRPGEQTEMFEVESVRLDAALDRVPDLVKLDLEGSELFALKGATAWFTSDRPPIWLVEHNLGADRAAGHRGGDAWRALLERCPGYQCWFVATWLRPISSPEELDAFPRQGNLLFRCG